MKKIIGKLIVLFVLTIGIGFVATDNSSTTSAMPCCSSCEELSNECDQNPESPACIWAIKCWNRCSSGC